MLKIKNYARFKALMLFLLLSGMHGLFGATWYVSQQGNDDNDGLSWSTALGNPQTAIDRASPGDQILIGEGTYSATHIVETSSDTIYSASFVLKEGVSLHGGYLVGQDTRVQGEYAWSYSGKTILTIPEGNSGSVLVNETPFATETVIDGITIEGGLALGSGEDGRGGGARLSGAIVLRNCVIIDNFAGNGGGVYLAKGASLRHSLVQGNGVLDDGWGGNGGGIYAAGNAHVSNCLITGNGHGVRKGGGIYTSGAAHIQSCTITDNEAIRSGSGLHMDGQGDTVSSTVIWGNKGTPLQAVTIGNVTHCAIEGNCPNNSCIPLLGSNSGIRGTAHNDNWVGGYYPCFNSPDDGDWRPGAGSYLINRGIADGEAIDCTGNARTLCGTADIGAFETPYRGNLALDFELELPCIYGNACAAETVPGALTPADIDINFMDTSFTGLWQNDNGNWHVYWLSAGTALPMMSVTPANTSHWNAISLQRELSVSRRAIYISADDKEYTYLEDMPSLTWRIVAGSLADGDTIDGTLICESKAELEIPWPIKKGSLAINDGAYGTNYALTFLNGEMICHKAEPEMTFSASTCKYNGSRQTLNVETVPPDLAFDCEYMDINGARLEDAPVCAGKYTAILTIHDAHYGGTFTRDFTIEKATLTAQAEDASRQYQSQNGTFKISVTGFLGNDGIDDIVMPEAFCNANSDSPVGEYPITVSGGSAGNYDFNYVGGTLTITKADVSASVEDSSLVYGDSIENAPIIGQAFHTGSGTPVSGAFSWIDRELKLDAGDNEVAWTFHPDNAGNFKESSGTAIIHVAQQALLVKADDIDIPYGDDECVLTYSLLPGTRGLTPSGSLSRESGNNVGSYRIKLGNLDFGPNYHVEFVEGTYTIIPREIKVKMLDAQKEYGDTDPELKYSIVDGTLAGDSFFIGAPARDSGEAVGNYAIGIGNLAISDSQNYSMLSIPGTFSITRSSKPGQLASLEIGHIKYGDRLGDIPIMGTMLTTDGTKEMPGYFQWKYQDLLPNAGKQCLEWIFTPYEQANASPFSGSVEIEVEKAVLNVLITGGAVSRNYKEENPKYELEYYGFIGNDDATCIKISPKIQTNAEYESLPGTYTVSIQGGEADNYTFQANPITLNVLGRKVVSSSASEIEITSLAYGQYLDEADISGYIIDENTGDMITGTFLWKASTSKPMPGVSMQQCIFIPASTCYTGSVLSVPIVVEKCHIRISSLPSSKKYGEADPELHWFCIDDMPSFIQQDDLVIEIGRADGEDAGSYETFLVAMEENSVFDLEFIPGVFTIEPLPLQVTANDTFKYYMANDPLLNCTVTSQLPEGVLIKGAPAREPGEEIGTYTIGMGSLKLSSPNYCIQLTEGVFTIYKRPLNISLVNNWKVYDKQPETLQYTVRNTLEGSDATLVGTISRKAGENIGNYLVDKSGLQPTDPEHFCVSSDAVWFTIKPREVTVKFDDQECTYLDPCPTLTYQVVEGTVLDGDAFAGKGSCMCSLGTSKIILGTLTLGSNYRLTCIPGTMTVYTDVPYLVFEGFDREFYAYEMVKSASFSAKAYRVHFDTPVEGKFTLVHSSTLNAGTETATLRFSYKKRISTNSDTTIDATTEQTIAFNVNKLRMTIKTGNYTKTYGDEWPQLQYELVSCCSDSVVSPLRLLTGDFLSFGAGDGDVGTFPIVYDPEKMTNNNVDLAVQTGTITISPRILVAEAQSGYSMTSPEFDTESLDLDYDLLAVVNTNAKNVDLEAEKENAPKLKMQCNGGDAPGICRISFKKYNPDNYENHVGCYDFKYADGVLLLFDDQDKFDRYESRLEERNAYSIQHPVAGTFDVVFVTNDNEGKGENYYTTVEEAYSNVKGGGMICIEPGSYALSNNILYVKKPLHIIGLADENGEMPTLNGKLLFNTYSFYCNLENLCINSSENYAIYVSIKNSNLHIEDCSLLSQNHAINRADSTVIADNCTYSAPKLYNN